MKKVAESETPFTEDLVKVYLNEIGETPILSREEEVELAKRIEQGDEKAREKMVLANLRLVISVAKKYRGWGLPFLDLIQEENIGLMKAIEKFDYCEGYKFSTCAHWWIRQRVRRAAINQGRTIRIPSHIVNRLRNIYKAEKGYVVEHGKPPTKEELAKIVELPPEKVEQAKLYSKKAVSLEKPIGDDEQGKELGQLLENEEARSPSQEASADLLKEKLGEVMKELKPREQRILEL